MPSPWSRTEKCANALALASSFSSFLPSAASAASGQTTSNNRFPSCLRVGASNSLAWSTMCASARSRVPAGRSSYSLGQCLDRGGDDARPSPHRSTPRPARPWWRGTSRRASCPGAGPGAVPRWWSSSRAPATPASTSPRESAPTPSRSACTSSRSSSSSNRACCLCSSTNASRSSSGVIDHNGTSASRSNAPASDAVNRTTGCPAGGCPTGGGGGAITEVMTPR